MSIMEEIDAWEYPKGLPNELQGFQLDRSRKNHGTRNQIFAYECSAKRRQFIAFYDEATRDFMVRIIIGLTEYNDVTYIVPELDKFETLLRERMEDTLRGLVVFDESRLESVLLQTKVTTWPYEKKLPPQIGCFELFIPPSEPIRVINGSYIVLDYSCFVEESNLLIYYNIYRDEYFGEIRLRRTPEMTFDFDSKSLTELEEKFEEYLVPTLKKLEERIAAQKGK